MRSLNQCQGQRRGFHRKNEDLLSPGIAERQCRRSTSQIYPNINQDGVSRSGGAGIGKSRGRFTSGAMSRAPICEDPNFGRLLARPALLVMSSLRPISREGEGSLESAEI
ncbi:uncharacterized protein LOC143365602 [Halictus rubicundus]|uniref:uncharacterized protein LOC143365602 n=1 Tax=Halictus rubicundus TaxID=77578 RepID=UPI004035192F